MALLASNRKSNNREECAVGATAFIKAYHYYINADSTIGRLLYLIRYRSAALGIVNWTTPYISTDLRSSVVYKLSAIALRCIVGKLWKYADKGDKVILLPGYGELAILCFPGYVRVFDLEDGKIVNCWLEECQGDKNGFIYVAKQQVELGRLGIAPKVFAISEQENIYIEELFDGIPLNYFRQLDWDTIGEVCEKSRQIQNVKSMRQGSIVTEKERLFHDVFKLKAVVQKGPGEEARRMLVEEVENDNWGVTSEREMGLYFSHGDLARRNVLVDRAGKVVFIDWQTLSYRSKDYDIYNFHFSVVEEGTGSRGDEEQLFDHLNKVLNIGSVKEAVSRVMEFKLFLYITKIEWFLLPIENGHKDFVDKLERMLEYGRIIERYKKYCERYFQSFAEQEEVRCG